MSDRHDEQASKSDDDALFLIEIPGDSGVRYVICERIISLDPEHGKLDLPWNELAAFFKGKTLRAVPMPGKLSHFARSRGVSTGPGVSTTIQIKIGGD
jgi:hypothetical protein